MMDRNTMTKTNKLKMVSQRSNTADLRSLFLIIWTCNRQTKPKSWGEGVVRPDQKLKSQVMSPKAYFYWKVKRERENCDKMKKKYKKEKLPWQPLCFSPHDKNISNIPKVKYNLQI